MDTNINSNISCNINSKIYRFHGRGQTSEIEAFGRNKQYYFEMISNGKVNEPRGQTLDYYNIKRGDDGKHFQRLKGALISKRIFGNQKVRLLNWRRGALKLKGELSKGNGRALN